MFRSYYGLSFNPFDKQMCREKDRFLSKDISEMMNRLDYLKDTRGIGVFTARSGMGKSFGLRCFAKSLNPSLYHMEYICLSTVSVMEFFRQLCAVLGVEGRGGKPGMFCAIQEQILCLYHEKKQPPLTVDEAQYLSTGILEDIKMLMNYGYDSVNCFTLVLCGEPHLNSPRITVHDNFNGFTDAEVAQYVLHKLFCVGGSASIIDQAALCAVHSHFQGNPRLVDNLMTDALALGAQMEKNSIDTEVILAAVSNQNLS